MKTKLFLNSTDVADITGYSITNARLLLNWVRIEYGIQDKWQVVSLFLFCECYDLPIITIYEYINNMDYKLLPQDGEANKSSQSDGKPSLQHAIDMRVFEAIIHKPRANR